MVYRSSFHRLPSPRRIGESKGVQVESTFDTHFERIPLRSIISQFCVPMVGSDGFSFVINLTIMLEIVILHF